MHTNLSRNLAFHDPILRQGFHLRAAGPDDVGHGAVPAARRGVVEVLADPGWGAARALGRGGITGGSMRCCGQLFKQFFTFVTRPRPPKTVSYSRWMQQRSSWSWRNMRLASRTISWGATSIFHFNLKCFCGAKFLANKNTGITTGER